MEGRSRSTLVNYSFSTGHSICTDYASTNCQGMQGLHTDAKDNFCAILLSLNHARRGAIKVRMRVTAF